MYLRLFSEGLRLGLRCRFHSVHAGRVLPEGLAGLAIARLLRLPLLVYAHGEEITSWRQPAKLRAMRAVYRRADAVIANSGFTRDLLLEFGVEPQRIHVVHPGVDLDVFRPRLETEALRRRFGLEKKRVILTVGRSNRRKGFDTVIRALPAVLREVSDAHYAVVGVCEDQQYLSALSAQMAVSDHVTFVGKASEEDLPLWYNLCDIFAMPNRRVGEDIEGFGMVFIEANACGKPVIAGIDGGTASAVIDGQTGLRVDGTKVQDVERGILSILRSPELGFRLGLAGLERVRESFSWQTVAARTHEVLTNLGDQRLSRRSRPQGERRRCGTL
jgi:phosphatidylinositol alpha-1,6-mannosyltransferase